MGQLTPFFIGESSIINGQILTMAMLNYWIFNHQGAEYSVVDPPKIDQPARWIPGVKVEGNQWLDWNWNSTENRKLLEIYWKQDWKLVRPFNVFLLMDESIKNPLVI